MQTSADHLQCLAKTMTYCVVTVSSLLLACPPIAAQTQSLPGIVVTSPKQDGEKSPAPQSAASNASARRPGANALRPVIIVNGMPITNEEIEMRANLLSLSPQLNDRVKQQFQALAKSPATTKRWTAIRDRIIQQNQHTGDVELIKAKLSVAMRNYQMELSQQAFKNARSGLAKTMRNQARQDLIDEQIKLNAPSELGIKINDQAIKSAVDRIIADRAAKAKKSPKEYAEHLRKLGTDVEMMRQSIRAQFIWREVVRMKYRPFITPNLKEVEDVITSSPTPNDQANDDTQYKLHRIVMKLAPTATQQQKIQTQMAAEAIMNSFKGCATSGKLAGTHPNTSYEDLGTKRLTEIPEPARSLLRHAKAGEILPPQPAYEGLHLYALCERTASAKATEANRKDAEAKIISDVLDSRARGLLLDLRRRARIEER